MATFQRERSAPGATHRLPDGTRIRLRAIGPADRAQLLRGFERLSDETRYRRFFSAVPRMPEALVTRLLDTDGWNHLAIGAESAETAVTVVDELQRRGLGRLLLAALGEAALARGVRRFSARVLASNAPMKGLLRSLGAARPRFESGQLLYELELPRRAA
jgi:GNAT superfamily N-acetyltransferase